MPFDAILGGGEQSGPRTSRIALDTNAVLPSLALVLYSGRRLGRLGRKAGDQEHAEERQAMTASLTTIRDICVHCILYPHVLYHRITCFV